MLSDFLDSLYNETNMKTSTKEFSSRFLSMDSGTIVDSSTRDNFLVGNILQNAGLSSCFSNISLFSTFPESISPSSRNVAEGIE